MWSCSSSKMYVTSCVFVFPMKKMTVLLMFFEGKYVIDSLNSLMSCTPSPVSS